MAPVKRKPHPLRKHFLREWRNYREMSLEAVASAIGVDHSTLQRIETFQTPYTQIYLEKLSEVYRCDVTALIAVDPSRNNFVATVTNDLMNADPDMQRRIAGAVASILDKQFRPQ